MQENNRTYTFYGPEEIQRYLKGDMSAQEMHDLEKAALKDPLLADAIDGFSKADWELSRLHFNQIKAEITGASTGHHLVVPLQKNASKWWRGAAAACIILGVIGIGIWWQTQDVSSESTPLADLPALSTTHEPTPTTPKSVQKDVVDTKNPHPPKENKTIEKIDNQEQKRRIASIYTSETKSPAHSGKTATSAPQVPIELSESMTSPVASLHLQQEAQLFSSRNVDSSIIIAMSLQESTAAISSQIPTTVQNQLMAPVKSKERVSSSEPVVVAVPSQDPKIGTIGDFRKFKSTRELKSKELVYPEEGWAHFYQELGNTLHIDSTRTTTKTIQIRFRVDDNGDPVDFEIVESPDAIQARKVIEQIKKHKWKNSTIDKNAVVRIYVN
jgi:hypothetical protein